MFIKEVSDMKDARVEEVLEGIANTTLVYLPDDPLLPEEFVERSLEFNARVCEEIKFKLFIAEKSVIDLVNKFVEITTDPQLQELKYEWMDPVLAVKPIVSTGKVQDENLAFKEIDRNVVIDIAQFHKACIELFAYFNSKVAEALVRSTKKSLDMLKQRATQGSLHELRSSNPIMKTYMELHIPNAIIDPNLDEIQNAFTVVLANILNLHKGIPLWAQFPDRNQFGEFPSARTLDLFLLKFCHRD